MTQNENFRSAEIFVIALLVLVSLLAIGYSLNGWIDCNDKGGAWVKGAFLYECVEKK